MALPRNSNGQSAVKFTNGHTNVKEENTVYVGVHVSSSLSNDLVIFLSHSILVVLIELAQFALEIHCDFKIQVALVPLVGLHLEHAENFLSLKTDET